MNVNICRFIVFVLSVCMGLVFVSPKASAILLTESQIVINPDGRTATLTVKNTSADTIVYRFVWAEMYLDENNNLTRLKDGEVYEGLRPASDFIRHSPSRLRMLPGQVQQIRFLVRRTKGMEDGEYRSYFSLMPEPRSRNVEIDEGGEPREAEAAIDTSLEMNVGWRIPVILRHGKLNSSLSFKDVKFGKRAGDDFLFFRGVHEGNYGVIAQARVVCKSAENSVLGEAVYRVYPETKSRLGRVRLNAAAKGCEDVELQLIADHTDPVKPNQELAKVKVR